MSKKQSTSYSHDEFVRDTKKLYEELLGRKLGDCAIGGYIDGDEFELCDFEHPYPPKTVVEKKPKERYLTRGQTTRLLDISKPELHNLTNDSVLQTYLIGGKVRYKLIEVEALKEKSIGLSNKEICHA